MKKNLSFLLLLAALLALAISCRGGADHAPGETADKADQSEKVLNVYIWTNYLPKEVIAEFERRYLADVLSTARGNVTRAARLVGKERRAFGRLLKKHDIDKTVYCR